MRSKKSKIACITSGAAGLLLSVALGSAEAGKSVAVQTLSNGYPSGPHFNLNIHGKKDDFNCPTASGGKSLFVPEFGPSTLRMVTNKKASLETLTVLDKCGGFSSDTDSAVFQLPYLASGYYVYGVTRGKPNNGGGGGQGQGNNQGDATAGSIVMTQSQIVEACNDANSDDPTSTFGELTSCPDGPDAELVALGLVTTKNAFIVEDQTFVRVVAVKPPKLSKEEKTALKAEQAGWTKEQQNEWKAQQKLLKNAIDITDLFLWSGFVCPDSFDLNGDGILDEEDIPSAFLGTLEEYLLPFLETGECLLFDEYTWIGNVADLVVSEQGLINDGIKILKIRFYPVDTTEFR
jgi:hypothetical protein